MHSDRHFTATGPLVLLLAACLLVGGGCATSSWVAHRAAPRNPLTGPLQLDARDGPRPTPRVRQLLGRYELLDTLKKEPRQTLESLHERASGQPNLDHVYALAELAYLGGRRIGESDERAALDLYSASVMHAYHYLFAPQFAAQRNPYDPQFRRAADLYNISLEAALRIVQKRGMLQPGRTHTIETASRQIDVTVDVRGTSWNAEDIERLEFASDYEVEGLRNMYGGFGLGVPLIAVRRPHPGGDAAEDFYPPKLSFPVTAVLRMQTAHSQRRGRENEPKRLQAVVELHDPLAAPSVRLDGVLVPLQSDVTTPLAYYLNQPEFDENELSNVSLLNTEKARKLRGVYMLEPYRRGKIPVVMVHGVWSSPVTWMEMFNDLRSEPEIRRRYQFWFYFYPSGQPFWYSAVEMREDLARLRTAVDPRYEEPALDQMVLVGHSMGGLIAKLQTVESGNEFWRLLSDRRFEELRAEPEIKEALARTFFFEPNPSVRRVVTISTPHRGSWFANDATRWLARKLIQLPQQLLEGQQKLVRDNPGYFRETSLLSIATGVDSLAPDSPFLAPLLRAARPPGVAYHNIVGSVADRRLLAALSRPGDGVVSLESGRLEEADSETVVSAHHSSVQRHPRTILEVRRILLAHLAELRTNPYAAAPHAAQPDAVPRHETAPHATATAPVTSPR